MRLLNRPQGAARTPQPAKLIVQAQSRLLLVDQAEICYAAIDEGVIRVVTQTFEGHSKCRTLEELLELLDPALFWRAIAALWSTSTTFAKWCRGSSPAISCA